MGIIELLELLNVHLMILVHKLHTFFTLHVTCAGTVQSVNVLMQTACNPKLAE